MIDRVKSLFNHSKMESISNDGEVELKIIQVKMETKRQQNKRKPMDEKCKTKQKKTKCPGLLF